MDLEVLDPTNETRPPVGQPAPRPTTLTGKTIGFISNGKEGTKRFFAHLEQRLRADFGVANVIVRVKSNFSAPAEASIAAEITQCDAVVSGIGD
jgi:hypothetical protein